MNSVAVLNISMFVYLELTPYLNMVYIYFIVAVFSNCSNTAETLALFNHFVV